MKYIESNFFAKINLQGIIGRFLFLLRYLF